MATIDYSASRIFTGEHWLKDHIIRTEDGFIRDIVPAGSVVAADTMHELGNVMLVPAFIDLQIYGAGGRLLAVHPEAASLEILNEYCKAGGAAWHQPTVATNTKEVFFQCIDAVRAYWDQGGEGVLGLHLEGPWINPVKRGAHIESFIHPPAPEEVEEMLDYGRGVITMITLAPECCDPELVEMIRNEGIVISAGHSNATYVQATDFLNDGIETVTHLYNAMSPLQHRAPGLAGAVMDHKSAMASIIPDGHHVDYAALRIAKKVMGDRLFVITDAVTETSTGHYPHQLAGDKYESSGILSGSALDMITAVHNLEEHAGIAFEEALRMCSLYPAKAIGKENELGRIEKGYRVSFTVLNMDKQVLQILH